MNRPQRCLPAVLALLLCLTLFAPYAFAAPTGNGHCAQSAVICIR